MGISTDAILFYGYIWEPEYEFAEDQYDAAGDHSCPRFYADPGRSNEVMVGAYSHIDYPGYLLAIKDTYRQARRGQIVSLDDVEWNGFDQTNWLGWLHVFAQDNGVEGLLKDAKGAGWFLVSDTDF